MIVIMGPGQCGTTYLIQMFHALGVDPGGHLEIFHEVRAKIKAEGKSFVWPDIIKGCGSFCVGLKDKADYYGWDIEHIFFCYRQFDSIARSRVAKRRIEKSLRGMEGDERHKAMVESIATVVGKGIDQLAYFNCPVTMVKFPDSLLKPDYRDAIFLPLGYTKAQIDQAHDDVGMMNAVRFGG